jgi:hypothetical protein
VGAAAATGTEGFDGQRGDEEAADGDGDHAEPAPREPEDLLDMARRVVPQPYQPPPEPRQWLVAKRAALDRKLEELRGKEGKEKRIKQVEEMLQQTLKAIKRAGGGGDLP